MKTAAAVEARLRAGAVREFPLAPARTADLTLKRFVDVALSLVGLVLTLPAWVLVPLAIKLEDGGPVFYGQQRVGRGGRRFMSWKFRSMKPRRDEDGPLLQAHLEEDRITRIGRLMRATALDELPQLWSILRGDMSLVGPRALLPEEIVSGEGEEPVKLDEVPGYWERHSVRPGLTGLAQVHAPRNLPHRKKFRYDLLYVRRRTVLLDLILVVRSVLNSLTGAWPRVGRRRRG
jgi:lipopolysaccharide/colanic/teichoic acid biosynthesis glycosyltransferase